MFNESSIISVIGLGYVGLPTALVIANRGYTVIGVDTNAKVISQISRGQVPLFEPDLDLILKNTIKSYKFSVSLEPQPADVFIISVPTPFKKNKVPDLKYLRKAVNSIAPVISQNNLIILESTSPVGTTEKVRDWLARLRLDLNMPGTSNKPDIYIAHSPERVLPGKVFRELIENDRVIGGITPECTGKAIRFYNSFISGKCHATSAKTAELIKLSENAFRDTNIAFANEISIICESLNVDVWEVIELANMHPRVDILNPGPGVGGHCIAVDPWFIVDSAPRLTPLIQSARKVNNTKTKTIIKKIRANIRRENIKKIGFLGLSYKANIDDLRESPSLQIAETIANKFDGKVLVCEPNIKRLPERLKKNKNTTLVSLKKCLDGSDLLILLTDHTEFLDVPLNKFKGKKVIDTRGVWRFKE